jgi:hypothetical protein
VTWLDHVTDEEYARAANKLADWLAPTRWCRLVGARSDSLRIVAY